MSANLTNAQYVNITTGEVRITAFAQNGAGEVKVFSLPFSTPTGGISVSVDTILGRNREINDIFNKAGNFAGTTSGKEVLVAKDGSITLKDDFVYLSSGTSKSIETTKSLMRSLAMGDMFTSKAEITGVPSVTAVPYKVVGTNGTVKTGLSATGNKIFGLLTQLDGRLVVPQSAAMDGTLMESITTANTRVTAYNKSSICVMFEILTTFDTNKSEGYRFVYTLNSNFKYQEADDANEVSFDQMMLSDVRYISTFFYKGIGAGEGIATVPGRKVKVGTSNVVMFKSLIGTITYTAAPVAAVTVPTNYIDTDLTIKAYTPATGDICIGYKEFIGTTIPGLSAGYYFVLKYDTSAWHFVLNDSDLNTSTLTLVTATLADADALLSLKDGNGPAYSIYDFDFELEDFGQV